MKPHAFVLALLAAVLLNFAARAAEITPARLRCEYLENPSGIDAHRPRLSWIVTSEQRGQLQTRYQILVASSTNLLAQNKGDLWDSGQVKSDETINIAYHGRSLESARRVFWKVRAWDKAGHPSAWSAPSTWTMGNLNDADWQARWITLDTNALPAPSNYNPNLDTNTPLPNYATLLLRREFKVKPGLRRAVVFVCGLGYYEMTLNGAKITDRLLTPG